MGICLVVDDEPDVERLIKQRFRHEIKEGHMVFHFAQDGEVALGILREYPAIDMVLTDINMPRMDGLTLLNHIQAINPIAKTIVVSAYGDMDNIRTSMNRGAFDFIIKPINFEDLRATMDKTLRYVTEIKDSLTSARENSVLRMYVNPSIVHYLKDDKSGFASSAPADSHDDFGNGAHLPKSRRISASVMFVDICAFTNLSERLSPELIAILLNTYFDEIAQECLNYKGSIDKFIGDAAMIVFEGENHVFRSVDAALGILKRLSVHRGKPLGEDAVYPGISIGLNTGEMVSGNFGSESIRRLDYTVIGDVVNTASRLETVANDGQILIGEALYSQISKYYQCKPMGMMQLRNKAQPMDVYQILLQD